MFYDGLMTEEERDLQQEVRQFVREEVPHDLVRALDRDEIQYPRDFVEKLAAHNLLGLRFDPKWGGRGLPWTAEVIAEEEIGVLGTTLGCAFVMPSIVGEALHVFGTETQKERFLRPILEGKLVSAEALTEPRGGSDFFGATSRAELKGDRFVVNGQKRFMGTRGGGTGRLVFRDVEVPKENLMGELHGGVDVFNQMMIPERLTSAAASLGVRAALEVAARYSDKRRAFGQRIRRFQGVSFKIADAITQLDAARAMVYMAARAVDSGSPNCRRLVSQAKKFATDTAWNVSNLAMQITGGIGYTDVYPIEKMVRDFRLSQIWTGTNEIMNLLIQHEYYKEVLEGSSNRRNIELDAASHDAQAEKCFTDEDMWLVHGT
ncbi:MAG: acyl-CoA/acyl-ACP dehydrogenase [Anaerolineales bacterium]